MSEPMSMETSDAIGLLAVSITAVVALGVAFAIFWWLDGLAGAWKGTACVAGVVAGAAALTFGSIRLASLIVTGA